MKPDKQWEIESDLSILQRAAEIRESPKRLTAVKKLADQRVKNLQSLASGESAAPKKTLSRKKTLRRGSK